MGWIEVRRAARGGIDVDRRGSGGRVRLRDDGRRGGDSRIRAVIGRAAPCRIGTALALAAGLLASALPAGAQEVVDAHVADADRQARESVPPVTDFELPTADSMVRVVDHREENDLEIVLGPVSLPAGLPHVRTPVQMAEWPIDGWMHGFSWAVRDGEGNPLPDELLHHLNLIDPDRRQLFSPISRRLAAAGRETPSVSLPSLVGVPLSRGTRMLVVGMFANPTDRSYEEAYLHVRLEYTPEEEAVLPRVDVYPFYLDVMGPVGDKSFPVPPGRTEVSWEGSPTVDARILGVGGHLHDYAVELRLDDVTTGETVWRTEPVTRPDEPHRVVSVETDRLWWKGGAKLNADHTYRATVVYENPTDEAAPHGGMGVIAGVVHTSEREWPGFDRQDPAYVADLWNTVTAPERSLAADGHDHEPGHGGMHGAVPGTIGDPSEIAQTGTGDPEGGARR